MNRKQYSATLKAVHMFRKEAIEGELFTKNTSFALVGESGVFLNPQTACFASLAPHYKNSGSKLNKGFVKSSPKEPFALLVGINLENGTAERERANITDEESVRYLDWLMNRSPWAKAFVSKAAETWYKGRVVVLDPTVAGNLMGGAGVAVRRLWESCNMLRVWLDLTSRGVPENLSYYLATCAGQYHGDTLSWRGTEPGHHNLNVETMGEQAVINFIEGKAAELTAPYSESLEYRQYSYMFGRTGGRFNWWVADNFPKETIKDGVVKEEVKATANPFAKAKEAIGRRDDNNGVPRSTALDNMAIWWPEIYKKLGIA